MATNNMATDRSQYFVITIEFYRDKTQPDDVYDLVLEGDIPGSQVGFPKLNASVTFDFVKLRSFEGVETYGRELGRQLFIPAIKDRFQQHERTASDYTIRLIISIGEGAERLEGLRWELLCHPDDDTMLATNPRILVSRFIPPKRDGGPVKAPNKYVLRALVAIAAPTGQVLEEKHYDAIDVDTELGLVKAALSDIEVRELVGLECTLANFESAADGVDLVYLVAHGTRNSSGEGGLLFPKRDGSIHYVSDSEIVEVFRLEDRRPRLVVLAACQSAGNGETPAGGEPTVQASLAGRLARIGVDAIVAMQGSITMETTELMMPIFFRELLLDGQLDRAMTAARKHARHRKTDVWMPALFCRLRDGRFFDPQSVDNFGEAVRHFRKTAAYKHLHDLFHGIEVDCYLRLKIEQAAMGRTNVRPNIEDVRQKLEDVRIRLEHYQEAIHGDIKKYSDLLNESLKATIETGVRNSLDKLRRKIDLLSPTSSETTMNEAIECLRELLSRLPDKLDVFITACKDEMKDDKRLRDIAGINTLIAEIDARTREHTILQQMDGASLLSIGNVSDDDIDVGKLQNAPSEAMKSNYENLRRLRDAYNERELSEKERRERLSAFHQGVSHVFRMVDAELKNRLDALSDPVQLAKELRG